LGLRQASAINFGRGIRVDRAKNQLRDTASAGTLSFNSRNYSLNFDQRRIAFTMSKI